jgi:two-component system, cell cycle sensor histidine kinase and response regulator CckA
VNDIGGGEWPTVSMAGPEAGAIGRHESEVFEAVRRYARLVELGGSGVWTLDPEGRITFANDAMARMLGCTVDEVAGQSLFRFLDDEWRATVEAHQQLRRQGITETFELKLRRQDGSELWTIISSTPAFDSEGRYVGAAGLLTDISEHKRLETQLLEKTTELEAIFQALPDLFFWLDSQCTILGYRAGNPSGLYAPPQSFIGRQIEDVLPGMAGKSCQQAVLQVLKTRSPATLEYSLPMQGGDRSFEARVLPLLYDQVLAVARDVTDQKRNAEALRDSEERYRTLVETSPDGIAMTDLRGIFLAANPQTARMLGYNSVEELLASGLTSLDFVAPQDRERALQAARQTVEEGPTRGMEYLGLRKDGTTFPIEITASTIPGPDGKPQAFIGLTRDITDRKRSENALRESEARFRRLSEGPKSYVFRYETNPSNRCSYISPTVAQIIGYAPEEFYADPSLPERLVHPDDLPQLQALRSERIQDRTLTFRMIHRDGHTVWVEKRKVSIFDSMGRKIAVEGLIRDITETRRDQQRLADLLQFQNEMLDTAAVWIEILDSEGNILFWNRAAEKISGYTRDEVLGHRGVWNWLYPDPANRDIALNRVKDTTSQRCRMRDSESTIRRRDGTDRIMSWYSSGRIGDGSRTSRSLVIGLDITEHRQLEEQLQRAQRLETAGEIAGQVAHDFNNLLGPFMAFPGMIKLRVPRDERIAEYCDTMVQAAERMADINSDLLVLGRRGNLEHQPTDVNRLVQEALGPIVTLPDTLVVALHLAGDLMHVSGAPSQLLRALQNLIVNAREALQDLGTLSIRTENVYLDRSLSGYNRVEVGEYVRVTVADTGGGIPPDIRDKVFDAFFTTKRTHRRGSGLGLTVVQSIIDDHKGYIDLESVPGKGTAFSIYLRACREAPAQGGRAESRSGTESLMVVDDDALQQTVLTTMLERLGYQVKVASSGEEALDVLREHPTDLLILDMVMPEGIDGAETCRRAMGIRPDQKAIILSGFAESDRVVEARSLGAVSFLRKPITLERLAAAVRHELDRTR